MLAFHQYAVAHRYMMLVILTGSIFLPLYHPNTVLTPRPTGPSLGGQA